MDELSGLQVVQGVFDGENGVLDILNAGLQFRDVVDSREGDLLETTISDENDDFIVDVDTFFEEIFHGDGVSLVVSNELLGVGEGNLSFFDTLEDVHVETVGGEQGLGLLFNNLAVKRGLLEGLESIHDLGEDINEVFRQVLLIVDSLDLKGNVGKLFNVVETLSSVGRLQVVDLVEQGEVQTATLNQGVDRFEGVVGGTEQVGNLEGRGLNSRDETLNLVGESSSLSETCFRINLEGSATSDHGAE